jgi:hypothetical protein
MEYSVFDQPLPTGFVYTFRRSWHIGAAQNGFSFA